MFFLLPISWMNRGSQLKGGIVAHSHLSACVQGCIKVSIMTTEFAMQAIKLSGDGIADFEGEVWDIAIDNSGGMLLAGINQVTDVGTLWYSTGDVTNKDNWVMYDIASITPDIPSNATRFYGACRYGNLMVAVGDFSQQSEGIMVYSKDSGASWTFAESGTGPLSRCQIVDGEVYITGADGLFAIFNP